MIKFLFVTFNKLRMNSLGDAPPYYYVDAATYGIGMIRPTILISI